MGRRRDSQFLDKFRDMLEAQHPQIHIQDTNYYYDVDVFNECEQTGTLDVWEEVHPFLITIPFTEKFSNPYGIIYAKTGSEDMLHFMELIKNSVENNGEYGETFFDHP